MTDKKSNFFKDLWERRFFQLLATYIGVSWGILQFLQFAITRYNWNGTIIDKFLLFALVLLPGVAVFIYNHGRSGHDEWKSYEKYLLPGNVFIALIISTLFSPKAVQAHDAMETITIQTDQDSTITRSIPKLQYTNRIVCFPIDGIDTEEWMNFATSDILAMDLEQDMRIFAISPYGIKSDFEQYNKKFNDKLDLGTMVKIAQDNYSDYFVNGSVKKLSEGYFFNLSLNNSDDGKSVKSKTFEGSDYYRLIDEASSFINQTIYSKEVFADHTFMDLPSESLVSSNLDALKKYSLAQIELTTDLDLLKGASLLEESILLDPTCGECYSLKARIDYANKDVEEGRKNIDIALRNSSGLPERQKLAMRNMKYQVDLDMERSLKLLETWSSLYPSDYTPISSLMSFYKGTKNLKKGIETGERAVANGHEGTVYTRLADMYNELGDSEKAKYYLQKFADRYPHKSKENSQLGDIYLKSGELDKALEVYERINIYNPDNIEVTRKIADIYKRKGDSPGSIKILNDALKQTYQTVDSFWIYHDMESAYANHGRIAECFEAFAKKEGVSGKLMPKVVFDAQFRLQTYPYFIMIDSMEIFKKIMYERFSQGGPQDDLMKSYVDMMCAVGNNDLDTYQKAYDKTEAFTLGTMGPAYRYSGLSSVAYIKGEYDEAYKYFKMYKDSTSLEADMLIMGAYDIYYKAKKEEEFITLLDRGLKQYPGNAEYLFKKGRAYLGIGDNKKAKELIQSALDFWKNADVNFSYKKEAEALMQSL